MCLYIYVFIFFARLAIIRKQREEAAAKREEEKKAREAVQTAKKDDIGKALGKKS